MPLLQFMVDSTNHINYTLAPFTKAPTVRHSFYCDLVFLQEMRQAWFNRSE